MSSNLIPALDGLTLRSSRGIVGRARIASPGLNRWLERRLSARPGEPGSLLAEPLFEAAKAWETHHGTMSDLSGGLLSADLVHALDGAGGARIPTDRHPYAHQVEAWESSLTEEKSVLVTAGTGAGKTECFLIPILQDLLSSPRAGHGVRAILLYPLNALIESQRERLRAWTEQLGGRVKFALLNGDTKHTEAELPLDQRSDAFELRSREMIRSSPPDILVINTTMLEYMLLRRADMPILEQSQGALRWVVLDEAHSYVGSQAAEMALLLRRVRSAFGVEPDDVRLMATSATIGGEGAVEELRAFTAALAGQTPDRVAVVEGREGALELPPAGPDLQITPDLWSGGDQEAIGRALASHPRIQKVRAKLHSGPVGLPDLSSDLFDDPNRHEETVTVLEAAATARLGGRPLTPWRAHLFHRAQGGVWACPDPSCAHRAEELIGDDACWPFGAAYLNPRPRCECGAPLYELVSCGECGSAHLRGDLTDGAQTRLIPQKSSETDDFGLDLEEGPDETTVGSALLSPTHARGAGMEIRLDRDGLIFENDPTDRTSWPFRLIRAERERGCCDLAHRTRLFGVQFGPAFFMGSSMPGLIEDLPTRPDLPDANRLALPAEGRRALTFTDSRQGVARLSAKLQQDSERSLTRSFLWHRVQEAFPQIPDIQDVANRRAAIDALRAAGLEGEAERIERELRDLHSLPAPVSFTNLINDLAASETVKTILPDAWRGMFQPLIAKTFLYRELFRRPRIQNNAETMGLVSLIYPTLDAGLRVMPVPAPLAEAGFGSEAWVSLVKIAIDYEFRDRFCVTLQDEIVPYVNPFFERVKSMTTDEWPRPVPAQNGMMRKLPKLIYRIIGGTHEDPVQRDKAQQVLDAIWQVLTAQNGPITNYGGGAHRLDLDNAAAVVPLERAWLCPVTRRVYGYTLNGWSPNDYARPMREIEMPRLPRVSRYGLSAEDREAVRDWVGTDERVRELRRLGVWSNLHDRLAATPPYMRSQEHSAQIERPLLKGYEEQFQSGRINLLNCTTTMEMGVDLANVSLVVNANVPPSLSNYRQRAGRAGRRGEPWAFTTTFCRNLPIDRRAFTDPAGFLQRPMSAPKVWLDSPSLVQKHVNAALLATWMRENNQGIAVTESMGPFMGVIDPDPNPQGGHQANPINLAEHVTPDAMADRLLADLEEGWADQQAAAITSLTLGTALEGVDVQTLSGRAREALQGVVTAWRQEHLTLLEEAAVLSGAARRSVLYKARRMHREFLIGELSRRLFTPAYGFPTDVVSFRNFWAEDKQEAQQRGHESPFKKGASRPLSQAIREYAPGADVVINGLVHRSEGVLTTWRANAGPDNVEDLRRLWSCGDCHAFGFTAQVPDVCPTCRGPVGESVEALRPSGFVSNKRPHTGYEALTFAQADPERVSAQEGEWVSLSDGAGRTRSDSKGRVLSSSSGANRNGYAICLACGRAESEHASQQGVMPPQPDGLHNHTALNRRARAGRGDRCSGNDNNVLVRRRVRLAQEVRTDVWEWQLPAGAEEPDALALAAALREALSELLGVLPDEVFPSVGRSRGPAADTRLSVFLHDQAAGGAGLSNRLSDMGLLIRALSRAVEVLGCREGCNAGCPACVLRPDLNRRSLRMDRLGGLQLARDLLGRLHLPEGLRLLGPSTRLAGRSAEREVLGRLRSGRLREVDIWMHGAPADWDLSRDLWGFRSVLPKLRADDVTVRIHVPEASIVDANLTLPRKLALHSCAQEADLHLSSTPPTVGEAPLLMRLDGDAFLVTAPEEGVPGPAWGAGASAPALIGPAPVVQLGARISPDRLVDLGVGNARFQTTGQDLDGDANGFGKRFWAWVAKRDPASVAALRSVGADRVTYSDRYLSQPYVLLLLSEVLSAVPGGATRKVVRTSWDGAAANPDQAHHSVLDEAALRSLLGALSPGTQFDLLEKRELAHERSLDVALKDGRTLRILLDQGFGAWRTSRNLPHDFRASPNVQARRLSESDLNVAVRSETGTPITIIMEA